MIRSFLLLRYVGVFRFNILFRKDGEEMMPVSMYEFSCTNWEFKLFISKCGFRGKRKIWVLQRVPKHLGEGTTFLIGKRSVRGFSPLRMERHPYLCIRRPFSFGLVMAKKSKSLAAIVLLLPFSCRINRGNKPVCIGDSVAVSRSSNQLNGGRHLSVVAGA